MSLVLKAVTKAATEACGITPLPSVKWADTEVDSLVEIEIIMEIEDTLGIEIDNIDEADLFTGTVQDTADKIEALLSTPGEAA